MTANHSNRPIQVFDPRQEVLMAERRLPHWSQAGTITFITLRTWDSIPKPVLMKWLGEKWDFLRGQGIDPMAPDWKSQMQQLDATIQIHFHRTFSDRWNEYLDSCRGSCVLRRPEISSIVSDSLRHFDGDRYELTDFVVMPNHVHLLVAFPSEEDMLAQCESWKHYTAVRINRWLDRKGRFWQQDGFDHLVRSAEQFEALGSYIADNPRRARLSTGEYIHYAKHL
ncbi:MAG: transposase [Planctomycetia bacterium]|nr:transposase [Planctomycetia bacterium]